MIYVRDLMRIMEDIAPAKLALPKDKIGLQVGRPDKPVRRLWVALEATPGLVDYAAKSNIDMIITHHALLFRPLATIRTDRVRDKAIATLLSSDIAVFSAHTNLDVTPGGVNDVIANKLMLENVDILDVTYREPLFKLVVYVPKTHLDVVRQALGNTGAGAIGNYSHCTFGAAGTGTFMPGAGTQPYIGQAGKLEHVDEVRLETIVPEHLLNQVLSAMQAAHPYEEVAYDVIPVRQRGQEYGIGRIGHLTNPMSLKEFANFTKDAFNMPHIRYAGHQHQNVHRVAVLGGSGGAWVDQALAKGADVLVTADVGHHTAAEAWQDGLAIVDATHAALEQPVCQELAKLIGQRIGAEKNIQIEVAPTDVDPFRWL